MTDDPRRDKLNRIAELGHDPWGQRFDDHSSIREIRSRTSEIYFQTEDGKKIELPALAKIEVVNKKTGQPGTQWVLADTVDSEPVQFRSWIGEQGTGEIVGPSVRAAGRIVLKRDKGKLRFIDIRDWTGDIQLFIGQAQVGEENWRLIEQIDLADIIGVDGQLKLTKTGELSIFAEKIHFLTKSLETPPEKFHGMTNPELRQRLRYLDLTYTDGVLDRFVKRTKIVQSIRQTLNSHNFCEIEGPTLHTIAGGAAARPFETHHNALDIPLVMRIALELHLKRLMVGGMERVYEMGRVYRNEGISQRHNPEFTMMEAYQAYGNYETMMELTERIIVDAIDAISDCDDDDAGTSSKKYELEWGDKTIDFAPPFARRTYDDLFAEHTGLDPNDADAIKALAEKIGLETKGKHPDVIKSDVFEEKVEDALIGPVFVIDYPASICPLTKRKQSNPSVAERFELFIHGMELANAYTELNDPDLQEQLFATQLEGQADEDSMAKIDDDFVRALRNGMPPAGGLGIGIDRLVMMLTNAQSIREVILFPLLRPEGSSGD